MSRRKQARPSRLLEDEEQENIKPNQDNKTTEKKNQSQQDEEHSKSNGEQIKDNNLITTNTTDNGGEKHSSEDANNNESKSPTQQGQLEKDDEEDETEKATATALASLLSNLQWPTASPNSITLEALQNTKVAVAQFAANALAAGAVGDNMQDLAVLQSTLFTLQQQQLLQLQLIQQLQQQLHVSSSSHNSEDEDEEEEGISSIPNSPTPLQQPATSPSTTTQVPNKSPNTTTTETKQSSESKAGLTTSLRNSNLTSSDGLNPAFASLLNCANQDPNRPLSPGLPPHQQYNVHHNEDEQPNTLEMLQKRAQEVLDSASQGLLASSLADDPRKKLGPYEKGREPFFKHRCRYCGKVFGSDSALQIHIRSHTGERPFKCNVCGSRFTTKGNLKVHFQRHTSKFPHIKMNPHPVPEHLDHFHPPLLSGSNSGGQSTPEEHSPTHSSSQPPMNSNQLPNFIGPPPGFQMGHPFSPLFRFDLKPAPPPPSNNNFIIPADTAPDSILNLTKPKTSLKEDDDVQNSEPEDTKDSPSKDNPLLSDTEEEHVNERSMNRMDHTDDEEDDSLLEETTSQDQPENLSSKSLPLMYPLPLIVHPPRPSSSNSSNNCHRPLLLRRPSSPLPLVSSESEGRRMPPSSGNLDHSHGPPPPSHLSFDPAKDPAIYTNLLPRPGSNDNAWESLIEVTKTSETSKLQQLVDNIEHKLTDPNQCIICHRVLSCKSALQMHYRTHTGERPFKCKICGRAFTTKGNLKTHMGVHRAKPPLRVLHQCPVCHKRFTNSLVLQQHIRLHTGEPTDLTPDQIRAAEVRDPYPSFSGFPPYGSPHFLPPGHHHHHHHPSSLLGSNDDQHSIIKSEMDDEDEDDDDINDSDLIDDEENLRGEMDTNELMDSSNDGQHQDDNNQDKPTTSLAALENQVRTITTSFVLGQNNKRSNNHQPSSSSEIVSPEPVHPEDLTNSKSTPQKTISDEQEDSTSSSSSDWKRNNRSSTPQGQTPPPSAPTTTSNFALDLTPRNSTIFNPFIGHHLVHHPQSLITPSTAALNSLANSVLNSTSLTHPFSLVPPPPPPPPPPHSHHHHHHHHHARQFNESESFLWTSRGNTTCQICLKTFACNSALEIHYRSHTKERPFKCNVCERGFSTKGNMKQHMLTHKIRDMPATSNSSFESSTGTTNVRANGQQSDDLESSNQSPKSEEDSSPPQTPNPHPNSNNKRPPSSTSSPDNDEEDNSISSPPAKKPNNNASPPPIGLPCDDEDGDGMVSGARGGSISGGGDGSIRSANGGTHGSSKHICKVCTKNFSSSSALHIHSRTHTGDRPFKCNVCQKAFTTKGNLKVHMGTHMWTNGVSRRGRRMSLDPLSVFLPGAPNPLLQQSERRGEKEQSQQRRPMPLTTAELFYPYAQTLAAPIFHPNGSLNVSERSKRFGSLSKLEDLVLLDEERKISIRSAGEEDSPSSTA